MNSGPLPYGRRQLTKSGPALKSRRGFAAGAPTVGMVLARAEHRCPGAHTGGSLDVALFRRLSTDTSKHDTLANGTSNYPN